MYDGPPGKTKKRANWLTGQVHRLHEHIERLDRHYEARLLDRDDWAELAHDTEKTIAAYERERDEILAYLATQPRPWWQFWK